MDFNYVYLGILVGLVVLFKELAEKCKDGGWKPRISSIKNPNHWFERFRIYWLNTPSEKGVKNSGGYRNKDNWGKSKLMKWLLRRPFVAITDGEHLFQHLLYWAVAFIPFFIVGIWGVLIIRVGIAILSGILNEIILKRM